MKRTSSNSFACSILDFTRFSKRAKLLNPKDLTSTHQTTIFTTIHSFVATGDFPETAKNLISTTLCTPVVCTSFPKFTNLKTQVDPFVSACGCPTEFVSSFLDHVMAPLVKDLPSYIKDTKHALQIFQNIHFHGTHKFIFTMDVKSLLVTLGRISIF